MEEIAISIHDLSKYYKLYESPRDRLKEALRPGNKKYHREFYALRNINIEVKKGEIIGIVGRNGSGKSTLLKLIAGVLKPNTGKINVNGKISALLELGSGFNPEFTGYQNINFYGTILGHSRSEMDEIIDDIIEFADIGDFINQPLKVYSSGMKARLGFAVAVHIHPEILILDEVLSVGDALFKRKCYAKMEEFFNGGATILYVSHDAQSINQLCTRAVLLDKGQVVMDADAKTVTTYYQQLIFANDSWAASKPSIAKNNSNTDVVIQNGDKDTFYYHEEMYIHGLISKSVVEFRNTDVLIKNAKIVNDQNGIVNLLEFNRTYQFMVDVEFGLDAEFVAFGFEMKDIKGVRLATVESRKMFEKGKYYSVKNGDVFRLKYSFPCLFNTGTYYLNFGVSSFDGEQKILNRILDVLVFKTVNDQGFSSGYFEVVDNVVIESGDARDSIKIEI